MADDEQNAKEMEELGLGDSGEELNVGLYGADNKKYFMQPTEEYESDELVEFLNNYKKGLYLTSCC